MEDNDLPPGFRFYPTEEELISFYLRNKLQGTKEHDLNRVIPVIDLYELHPSDLPQFAGELCRGDPEQWFFFSPRQEREARGGRPSRTTASGYWKATGCPSYVRSSSNQVLGMKKTMVFYSGRAPHGRKTEWKMNEYKAIKQVSSSINTIPQLRDEFSLCRVYVKNGSLRSFDRRPTGATTSTTTDHHHAITAIRDGHHQAQQGDHDHVDTAQRQHHDPPLMVAAEKINTINSPESSSSLVGSAVRPPPDNQTGHSDDDDDGDDNWQMEEDFQILLELEKLNWV